MSIVSGEIVLPVIDSQRVIIESLIEKYFPGLTYATGVPVDEDDNAYYGEWTEVGDGSLIFTTECDTLSDEEMTYVVLHEIAHALTDNGCHQHQFYGTLTALVIAEGVSWDTAIKIEELIPRLWEKYAVI